MPTGIAMPRKRYSSESAVCVTRKTLNKRITTINKTVKAARCLKQLVKVWVPIATVYSLLELFTNAGRSFSSDLNPKIPKLFSPIPSNCSLSI